MVEHLGEGNAADIANYWNEHPRLKQQALDAVTVVDINDTALRLLGHTERQLLLGPATNLTPYLDTSVLLGAIAALHCGIPCFRSHTTIISMDGGQTDVHMASMSLHVPCSGAILMVASRFHAARKIQSLEGMLNVSVEDSFTGVAEVESLGPEVNRALQAISLNSETILCLLDHGNPDLIQIRDLTARSLVAVHHAAELFSRFRSAS